MNIKVVIVWAFAIVIIGGIGLFGALNQDLLVEQGDDVYVPTDVNNTKSHACSNVLTNGTSSYRFNINEETDLIDKVIITYSATTASLDDYTAASNILNKEINGVSAVLRGEVSNFVLIVTVNVNELDKAAAETINSDFLRLSMVVDQLTDYETYKAAINNATTGNAYSCD